MAQAPLTSYFGSDALYRDWDYFSSSARTLQLYASEYHTIPTWNFMLCGGRPELANPQSWAWTWPSLFVYVFPGNLPFLVLWLLLSAAGFWAVLEMQRRLGATTAAAIPGALLYVANGYFASHFSQGHATFAFFHFVPILMLAALSLHDAIAAGRRAAREVSVIVLLSFLFFSAALPAALFYFHVAFVVFVVAIALLLVGGIVQRLRFLTIVFAGHGLGAALASYKLWPMVQWQLSRPRLNVRPESSSIAEVFQNTVRFIPDYHDAAARYFPGQVWLAWEYNAYVGVGAWILAAVGAAFALGSAFGASRNRRELVLPFTGVCCCVLGFLLSVGNTNPAGIPQFFANIPVASGIRAFSRYQILIVFGLAVLGATGIESLAALMRRSNLLRRAVPAVVALAVCAPPMWQAASIVRSVESIDEQALQQKYKLPPADGTGLPRLAAQTFDPVCGGSDQSYFLREGFWISNCYDPMNLERIRFGWDRVRPLSTPPPVRIADLDGESITLAYDESATGRVTLNLVTQPDFEYNVATRVEADGRRSFDSAELPGREFRMRRPPVREL